MSPQKAQSHRILRIACLPPVRPRSVDATMIHLRVSQKFTILVLCMLFGTMFIPFWNYQAQPKKVAEGELTDVLLTQPGSIDSQHLLLYQVELQNQAKIAENQTKLAELQQEQMGIVATLGTIATYFGIQQVRKGNTKKDE